jgi:hypothetical protein
VKAPSARFSWQGQRGRRGPHGTILFISLSTAQSNLDADWAEAGGGRILRHCPVCQRDSIIGHGRRRKQAHDEDHDWIVIRRGICNFCGTTFTFLPPYSPPWCHYSLIARSQALRRYFVEGYTLEDAAPAIKDPDRVADSSTLRRWFRSLDISRPPFSFLRGVMRDISTRLARGETLLFHKITVRVISGGQLNYAHGDAPTPDPSRPIA